MFANKPAMARRWASETPKNKKLPAKRHPEKTVTAAYAAGINDALAHFGVKLGGEEIRLQIPRREFHGWRAAWQDERAKAEKRADDDAAATPLEPQADPDAPVERLTAMLQALEPGKGPKLENTTKDRLERDVLWGAPSNLAGGDTANRLSDMGQPTEFGGVF
jgi:hypothetical protein